MNIVTMFYANKVFVLYCICMPDRYCSGDLFAHRTTDQNLRSSPNKNLSAMEINKTIFTVRMTLIL